ncbi:hypothetical protein FRB90_000877 [Tulasnella sp. 427]|nr:hypothetical protein FRB90_000877 [Tulasnella sp. 427]
MSRPGMRRKSSASNLLSTFKSGSSSTTPGNATPTPKEWDSQSLYSETSNVPTISSAASAPPLPVTQLSSVEYLRELIRKRLMALRALKEIHSGQAFWMQTILLTRADLERAFGVQMKKQRTIRYAILGMSLSSLLDISQPHDYLLSLLRLLQEFETVPEENALKPKMRNLFRGSKLPKKTAGGDYGAYVDVDASYLVAPNIPFALDHFQVAFSLFDVLAEIYKKVSDILGPSSIVSPSHGAQTAFGLSPPSAIPPNGPNGIQSPTSEQSVPNYFSISASISTADRMSPMPAIGVSGFMPAIAIAGGGGGGLSSTNLPGHPASPPPTWSVQYGDMFAKADQKIMRIISFILKKVDETARNRMREELAQLNPLLQNLSLPTGGLGYAFEDR